MKSELSKEESEDSEPVVRLGEAGLPAPPAVHSEEEEEEEALPTTKVSQLETKMKVETILGIRENF